MNGLIEWFARNRVAANLLMLFIILMGVNGIVNRLPVEVFPDFAPDEVEIRVTYRGATPEQMEESIIIPLENIIADLPGIEEIQSSASEGSARIEVEVASGHDPRELRDEVKSRVDAVNNLPEGIEPPVVKLKESLHEVVTLIIHGDMSEHDLRQLGERVRDEVGRLDGISRVVMRGLRNYEVSIEIPEQVLREHQLTLQTVADAVRNSAVDIPGGAIRSRNGEVLVRTEGRAFDKAAFEKIVVHSREDGSHLTLGELANVTDAFEEDRVLMRFNGNRCAVVHVARTGDQNALKIEGIVKGYLARLTPQLPEGVSIDVWNNRADIIKKRLVTLNDSAFMGIGFIIVLLGLFLRPAVALWVCVGVPVAFMGAFALMPYLGVTINLFTLYGFILVLGILVDDAIVTGDCIHAHQQRGGNALSRRAGNLRRTHHRHRLCAAAHGGRKARAYLCANSVGGDSLPDIFTGGIKIDFARAPEPSFHRQTPAQHTQPAGACATLVRRRPRVVHRSHLSPHPRARLGASLCHPLRIHRRGGGDLRVQF